MEIMFATNIARCLVHKYNDSMEISVDVIDMLLSFDLFLTLLFLLHVDVFVHGIVVLFWFLWEDETIGISKSWNYRHEDL